MKRVYISLSVIALIVVLCTFSVFRVNRICRDTEELLRQAETCIFLGDHEGAKNSVYYAQRHWKSHEGLLGVALRHTETDDIDMMFPPLLNAIQHRDDIEFYLRNMELIAAFKSISRMEIPYYFNIL